MRLHIFFFVGVALFLPRLGSAAAVSTATELPIAPAFPDGDDGTELTVGQLLAAHAPERVLMPSLRGVIFIGDPTDAALPVAADFTGVDTSRVPLFQQHPRVEQHVNAFLNRPVSLPSLTRLAMVVRLSFQERGENFAVVYVPPQDLTDGVVRVVAHRARLDGPLAIEGEKWFSEQFYRRALPLAPGEKIDTLAIRAGIERLNRSGYRRTDIAARPGDEPGTTRLELRVQDRRPWEFSTGYNNFGTPTTGEDRIFAGVTWGAAFGRDDVLGYSFGADAEVKHMISHSANYTARFASDRSLTLFGSWSHLESAMPEPLTQEGRSWQVGLRFAVPLRAPRENWTQHLSFGADFKYSDNTLDFAAIPITGNVTHIAHFGVTYGASFRALGGHNGISFSGYVSPGGLTRHNRTEAFEGSRPGAKAEYAYGTLQLSHARPLARGFSWRTTLDLQFASGALLGSEQLSGGGSGAVRGYGESTAFGDEGVMANNELHLPPWSLLKGRDQVSLFAFVDVASLRLKVDRESTELRSGGLGVNYAWKRNFALRAAYGWQLKRLPGSRDNGHGHVSANVSW